MSGVRVPHCPPNRSEAGRRRAPRQEGQSVTYLRPYLANDFETLYQLDRDCFAPAFRFSRAMLRRCLGTRGAFVRVACETGAGAEQIVGFCIAEFREAEPHAYVATLDVALAHRRTGLGRQLMQTIEEEARARGVRRVLLHVFTENSGAQTLYESLGYTQLGREDDFYRLGLHAWLYGKEIG